MSVSILPALGLRMNWPYFCEESTWHRIDQLVPRGLEVAALWISNAGRKVAMWNQRLARCSGVDPIVWDYHVVTLYRQDSSHPWLVEDPSSDLPLACSAQQWLEASFAWSAHLPREFHPRFRWIEGADYLREFCSNRRHMLDDSGRFTRPPPPWPPIGREGGSMIEPYSSDSRDCAGELYDLPGLLDRLLNPAQGPAMPCP